MAGQGRREGLAVPALAMPNRTLGMVTVNAFWNNAVFFFCGGCSIVPGPCFFVPPLSRLAFGLGVMRRKKGRLDRKNCAVQRSGTAQFYPFVFRVGAWWRSCGACCGEGEAWMETGPFTPYRTGERATSDNLLLSSNAGSAVGGEGADGVFLGDGVFPFAFWAKPELP
jgi:hypothetical protein